jgi:diguanylate cyclase (GGDEF)-like protein
MNGESMQQSSHEQHTADARILVVEDSAIQAELMRRFLVKEGFTVDVAAHGKEALDTVHHQAPDLIVTDVAMPEMNGFDFCRAIKADAALQNIPVILLTFLTDPRDLIEGLASGADTYVFKPFEEDDLRVKIQELLRIGVVQEEDEPLKSIEFRYHGDVFTINAGRMRILHYLITTYENAVHQSRERMNAQLALQEANETLAIKRNELEASQALLATRERQQAAVAQLGKEALSDIELSLVLDKTASLVTQTLSVEFCEILESLHDGPLLLRAGSGWDSGMSGHVMVGGGAESLAGYTLLSSRPVVVEDLRAETRFNVPPLLRDHGVVSGVTVVIDGPERPFGVLGVHTKESRKFSQDDINFIQSMANVLSAAVYRIRDEEEIRRLATTDSLTGAVNRLAFNKLLDQSVKHAERHARPFSLMMFELDNLKRVNDSLGHDTGDHVIKSLAALVRSNIRAVDTFARWSGQEFIILLPESDNSTTATLAEKLRNLIAGQEFHKIGRITASFGVTDYAPNDDSTAILKRANDALHRASDAGGNRVSAAATETA